MNIFFNGLSYGLLIAVVSIGVYISYKIMNVPDLTVDGSFTFGAVIGGLMCLNGYPILGIICSILAGTIAGAATGLIHTKLKVSPILSGVLVATALYSVNIWLSRWGKAPTSFYLNKAYGAKTIFMYNHNSNILELSRYGKIGIMVLIIIILITLLLIFFSTQLGLSIRATGNNEQMVKASSINTDLNKIISFALANAIVALAGNLFVQFTKSYDVMMGSGMLVTSLAAIIIGETIFGNRKLYIGFIIVVIGSVIYRVIYSIAIRAGSDSDIKFLSAFIIVLAIALSNLKNYLKNKRQKKLGDKYA